MLSFSKQAVALAAAALFFGTTNALYDANSKNNLAVYWGQGPGQADLLTYCQQSSIDIIPIGFVHVFPSQGNGYPGTNFGNKCWGGTYNAPGPNPGLNQLQSQCPSINNDIPICQSQYGKKIILSLGGGTNTYSLNGATEGRNLADFLWGAFGPRTAAWVADGKPRPFDGPNGEEVQVDGFDMDIEFPSSDNQAGYIALLTRLRELFATGTKQYLITGAPQCVVPDANMATMIQAFAFDALFIQFYNTPFCSARNYVQNPQQSAFSYTQWSASLANGASKDAKLYIGLPASPAAAGSGSYWLTPAEAKSLVRDFYCRDNFGGVMLWEATRAQQQIDDGRTYYENIDRVLSELAADGSLPCVVGTSTSSVVSSTTTSPTSTQQTVISTTSLSTATPPSSSSTTPSSTRTSTSTSANPTPTGLRPSLDGTCGLGVTCGTSCCSQWGWCGTSDGHCGTGCQAMFGRCNAPPNPITTTPLPPVPSTTSRQPTPTPSVPSMPISNDGACGPGSGTRCAGGCCSRWGWCGTGVAHCGSGCQSMFGVCS